MHEDSTGNEDRFELHRFLEAQQRDYTQALQELQAGRKLSHWIWYIFPQLRGLGRSSFAERYGISGLDEALAYVQHPVLGPRLQECARAVLAVEGRSATEIMGSPDDLKLRSCATLFERVSEPGSVFESLLEKYYGGGRDERTVEMLKG